MRRKIGLSLGADICWPICFEEILRRLQLDIEWEGERVGFDVERVTIEPFDLRQPCSYDLVIDRLTHWFHPSREWIKKSVIMNDLYVFNNPWSVQSMEKATTYAAMMQLGLPVPDTWLVPPKTYDRTDDLEPTLTRYARLFDLGQLGDALGYPLFMKPYDGGAWVGVTKIDDAEQLRRAYDESGKRVMHLQRAVLPFDLFVRVIGVGPQTRVVRYDPDAPLHDRYKVDFDFVNADEHRLLQEMTLTINSFFGWDFNSCECLRHDGELIPIDFANPCPDSQVTSLHFHFPWIVTSQLRWAVYCATTRRRMRRNLDWQPYYAVLQRGLPYRERLAAYAAIARERLESERFEEFCDEHLAHLDDVAVEFFASDTARDAVRRKVGAIFPEDEVERFTEHFWGLIQFWRKTEIDRIGRTPHGPSGEGT
ncbi:MAG TPA: hypothetical protein VD788_12870 [Candidatus Polarisedimenticolaceae bacterium]|nr:hypothetical protein [Candidatus Polarisedimenticolaceae bacterium]